MLTKMKTHAKPVRAFRRRAAAAQEMTMPVIGPMSRALVVAPALLVACAGSPPGSAPLPGPAQGSALAACQTLATGFSWPRTTLASATIVQLRELSAAGTPIGVHCRVV